MHNLGSRKKLKFSDRD